MKKVVWRGPFNSEEELIEIGKYRGVTICVEERDVMEHNNLDDFISLAHLYIDAYYSLWGKPPRIINASYASNNLDYLRREYWDESGDLYRIAVPFTAETDVVKEAQMIAGCRAGLVYDGDGYAFEDLPEPVQILLERDEDDGEKDE